MEGSVCGCVGGIGLGITPFQAEVLTCVYCRSMGKLPYLCASVSLAVKGVAEIGSFLSTIALRGQLTFMSMGSDVTLCGRGNRLIKMRLCFSLPGWRLSADW